MEPRDDERVRIELDPETALRALLQVDPESEPTKDHGADDDKSRDDSHQGRRTPPDAA